VFGDHRLRVPDELLAERPGLRSYEGAKVALGIRPEDLEDASLKPDAPADRRLRVSLDIRENMGSEVFAHFTVNAPPVLTAEVKEALDPDAAEVLEIEKGTHFIARVDRSSRAGERDRLELAVDTRRLHFFDLSTGSAIWAGAPERNARAAVTV